MNHFSIRCARIALLLFLVLALSRSQSLVPFRDKHGMLNYAEIDRETGSVKRIHGLTAHIRDYGKKESDLSEESIRELASDLVADYGSILKISAGQMRPAKIETDGAWWFANFQQVHEGVPVEGWRSALALTRKAGL